VDTEIVVYSFKETLYRKEWKGGKGEEKGKGKGWRRN
jgi:hypothetical protein